MAEIIGVVSGGASLVSIALQLGESAVKLKRFYHRVKDAQLNLADVAEDLEVISLSLCNLEKHTQYGGHDTTLLDRCARRFKEKADAIELLVSKLEARVNRFNMIGKVYLVLSQPETLGLLNELERVKSSLMIALQIYSM